MMTSYESLLYVSIAYIGALLPWQIINATDYLSSEWKSAGETFRKGLINLFISAFPLVYLLIYMKLQFEGKDYKEFCTALVALIFSGLHAIKTAWGLWQLYEFQSWVKKSVVSLRRMGIQYKLKGDKQGLWTPEEISKNILVNNMVVDNAIFQSRTLCFIKYWKVELWTRRNPVDQMESFVPFELTLYFYVLNSILFILMFLDLIFRFLLYMSLKLAEKALRKKISFPWSKLISIRLIPYKPVNVWLVWSSVFAAQGLGHWIKGFDKIENAENSTATSSVEKFLEKELSFSSDFLSSVILQTIPEGLNKNLGEENNLKIPFLSFSIEKLKKECIKEDDISYYKFFDRGLPLGSDILQIAARTGKFLPFRYAHINKLNPVRKQVPYIFWKVFELLRRMANKIIQTQEFDFEPSPSQMEQNFLLGVELQKNLGCKRFEKILRQIISEFPTLDRNEFFPDMDKYWGIMAVDTLLILLFLGDMEVQRSFETRDETKIQRNNPSQNGNEEKNRHESLKIVGGLEMKKKLRKEEGAALENLEHQLGYIDKRHSFYKKYQTTAITSPFKRSYMFPYEWEFKVSKSNNNVLMVAEVIDLWVSLCAGEDIEYLLREMSPHWEDWCRGIVHHTKNEAGGDADEVLNQIRSKNIVNIHQYLEMRRIRYKFADIHHSYQRFDQFVTFMGYGMEIVRSILSFIIVSAHSRKSEFAFNKLLDSSAYVKKFILEPSFNSSTIFLPETFTLEGSFLHSLLDVKDKKDFFKRRATRIRLLWEVKTRLEKKCLKEVNISKNERVSLFDIPKNEKHFLAFFKIEQIQEYMNYVIVLCIISFPSLLIRQEEGSCRTEHRGDEAHVSFQERFLLTPVCSPQNVNVCIILTYDEKLECANFKLQLNFRDNDDKEKQEYSFFWGKWRDAFTGRIRGMYEWRRRNGLMNPQLWENEMNGSLVDIQSSSETRQFFVGDKPISVWKGWLPFRSRLALFELDGTDIMAEREYINTVSPIIFLTAEKRYQLRGFDVEKETHHKNVSPNVRRNYSILLHYFLKNFRSDSGVSMSVSYLETITNKLVGIGENSAACQILEIIALEGPKIEYLRDWFRIFFGVEEEKDSNWIDEKNPINFKNKSFQELISAANLIEGYLGRLIRSVRKTEKRRLDEMKSILKICDRLATLYGENYDFLLLLATPVEVCRFCLNSEESHAGVAVMNKSLSYIRAIGLSIVSKQRVTTFSVKYARMFILTHKNLFQPRVGPRLKQIISKQAQNESIEHKLSEEIETFQRKLLHREYDEEEKSIEGWEENDELLYHLAFFLGVGLSDGKGPKNKHLAKQIFLKICEKENSDFKDLSKVQLAKLLLYGDNRTKENVKEGVKILMTIENENADACCELGLIYALGAPGLQQSPKQAEKYYSKVYKENILARMNLAELRFNGSIDESDKNQEEAISMCEEVINDKYQASNAQSNYANFTFLHDRNNMHTIQRAVEVCKSAIQIDGSVYPKLVLANIYSSREVQCLSRFDETDKKSRDKEIFELYDYVIKNGRRTGYFFWLNQSLRVSTEQILVHGGREGFLQGSVKYEYLNVLGMLNLASVYVEKGIDNQNRGEEIQEAFKIYNDSIDKFDSLWAKINLAFLHWNGICNIERDQNEALNIMEKCEKDDELGKLLFGYMNLKRSDRREQHVERAKLSVKKFSSIERKRISEFEELLRVYEIEGIHI